MPTNTELFDTIRTRQRRHVGDEEAWGRQIQGHHTYAQESRAVRDQIAVTRSRRSTLHTR